MVLKNDFYETIRSIDELEVDILDLENVNALIVKETTENFQIANGIANELRFVRAVDLFTVKMK